MSKSIFFRRKFAQPSWKAGETRIDWELGDMIFYAPPDTRRVAMMTNGAARIDATVTNNGPGSINFGITMDALIPTLIDDYFPPTYPTATTPTTLFFAVASGASVYQSIVSPFECIGIYFQQGGVSDVDIDVQVVGWNGQG